MENQNKLEDLGKYLRREEERERKWFELKQVIFKDFAKKSISRENIILMATYHLKDLWSFQHDESAFFEEFNIEMLDILLERTSYLEEWKKIRIKFLNQDEDWYNKVDLFADRIWEKENADNGRHMA